MSYEVKDYMIKEVNTIDYEASVIDAAKIMAHDTNFEGYVITLKKGKPLGMVTERDIINKVLARELDPSKTSVSDIISSPLITVKPDDDLLKTANLMSKYNVHKLVVVSNEIIYGIITAKNIAQSCGQYVDRSIKDIIRWSAPLNM
ncbi:MAG: CBS domain-containing protein [Candidatus Kariarchaeaceae archaeon]|jgi:CBS domain-containing protein